MSTDPYAGWNLIKIGAEIAKWTREVAQLEVSLARMKAAGETARLNAGAIATLQAQLTNARNTLQALKAAKAAKTALVVAETSETSLVVSKRGWKIGRLLGRVVPIAIILLALAAGVYVLSGQLGRQFADDSVKGGWRTRLPVNEAKNKTATKPLAKTEDGNFQPSVITKRASDELWRQAWSNSAVATRSSGEIIEVTIIEHSEGLSGKVLFFDAQGRERETQLEITELSSTDQVSQTGYRIAFQTGTGVVKGNLRVHDESGWLLGDVETSSGKVEISLIPQH